MPLDQIMDDIPWNAALRNNVPAPHGVSPSIDFETRSTVDLKSAGARRYAQHPTTRPLCMGVKIGPAEDMWVPGMPFPPLLAEALERGEIISAWNATFEIAIWQEIMVPRFGWPDLHVDRFQCTMQKAALVGCPGALERAVVALGLPVRKDMEGHKLMLKMCKPLPVRKDDTEIRWHDDPQDHLRNQVYCMDDCRAEAMAADALPPIPPMEAAVMRIDRYINMRGVRIDRLAAEGAAKIAKIEKARLNGELRQITNGQIGSTNQVAMILEFVQRHGVQVDQLRAADVREILNDIDDLNLSGDLDITPEQVETFQRINGCDPRAYRVLQLRAEAAKASTSKLEALIKGVTAEDVMTDLFAYGAAYRTQRWAGRRFQAHNLPRANPPCDTEDQIEYWYETLARGNYDEFAQLLPGDMSVMDGLKASLRGFITAGKGRRLTIADLGQIEARGSKWVAGQWDMIEAFQRLDAAVAAGADEATIKSLDIYTVTGKKMNSDRQSGKIAELACGYQGGWHALMAFASIYGIKMEQPVAKANVDAWRASNPMVVAAWGHEENAAKMALANPGQVIDLGRVGAYCYRGGNLMRRLPSGRCLIYRKMRLEPMPTPWGQTKMTLTYEGNIFAKGRPGEFIRLKTYGGKLFQNAVQAICRDILAAGLIRAHRFGLETVLHVHDEQAVDSPAHLTDVHSNLLVRAMTDSIPWVEGLPITSSADVSFRYRK